MKPDFRIPTMAEIRAIPPNGFNAVSTFAGCGGSSTGYRMAGYRMLLANEFIQAAGDSYEANMAEYTVLDRRDIRKVTAQSILDSIGLAEGQLDVFDGSPPCASFSMAGRRAALWGAVKSYSDTEQRVDDLFGEYLRIAEGLQAKVCTAENVPGLTIGVARGFYNEIMTSFDAIGYHAEAVILEAEWLGVPQARHRLFFVAVRKDLYAAGLKPVFPVPLPYYYAIKDALPHFHRVVIHNGTSGFDKEDTVYGADQVGPTIMAGGIAGRNLSQYHVEAETDITKYAIGEQWEKMGQPGTQSDKFFQLVRPDPEKPCPTVTATAAQPGAASVVHPTEKRKFSVWELKRLCAFPEDYVLTGSYSQQVERLGRAVVPPVTMHLGRTIADRILTPWAAMQKAKAA